MKKLLYPLAFLFLPILSNGQQMDFSQMSQQLFIDMTRDEIRDFFLTRVPDRYFEETEKAFTIVPLERNRILFRAEFDSLDICEWHMLDIPPEYRSVFVARALKAGYAYDENYGAYINEKRTIYMMYTETMGVASWKTGKMFILEEEE